MEFIANYNWSITVILIMAVIGLIVAGAYFIVWYGKLQARLSDEYERYYSKIQTVLDYEVCEANYEWICRLFDRLLQCKYKNEEMTKVLNDRFVLQYAEIIEMKRISQ